MAIRILVLSKLSQRIFPVGESRLYSLFLALLKFDVCFAHKKHNTASLYIMKPRIIPEKLGIKRTILFTNFCLGELEVHRLKWLWLCGRQWHWCFMIEPQIKAKIKQDTKFYIHSSYSLLIWCHDMFLNARNTNNYGSILGNSNCWLLNHGLFSTIFNF